MRIREGLSLFLALLAAACAQPSTVDPFSLGAEGFERGLKERFEYGPPKPLPAEVPGLAEGQAADAAYFAVFPDYDRAYSPEAREAARRMAAQLKTDAPTLTHEQFVLRIAEIAALADNAHTTIGKNAFRKNTPRIPLRTYWFPDGLYVLRAAPEHSTLLGARIDTIEGRSIDDVYAGLRRYQGGPENYRKLAIIPVLESPGLLAAAGLANDPKSLQIAGVRSDGSPFSLRIAAQERDRSAPVSATPRLLFADEAGPGGMTSLMKPGDTRLPLYLRDPGHVFSIAPVERGGLYVALGHNNDADEGRIGDFLSMVLSRISKERPKFVVMDLRMNEGGDYTRTYSFMGAMTSLLEPDGRIYALTSGFTFSAAITTTGAIRMFGGERATIVGSPVGDRLDFWAEGGRFQLPNSFITVGYTSGRHDYHQRCSDFTTCYWLNEFHLVRVPTLDPDIDAPITFAAYKALRDPAMEAVMAREARIQAPKPK